MTAVTDRGVRREPGELAAARARAGRMRVKWLVALSEGTATLYELFVSSTRPGGEPLQSMRLKRALAHQPGWRTTQVQAVMAELRAATGVADSTPDDKLNLRWLLLDTRTLPGSRLTALATAMVRQDGGLERVSSDSRFPYGGILGSGDRRGS